MTRDAAAPARLAAEIIASTPAPASVSDLDATTRRAISRAAQAAGLSEADFWAKTRAAASTSAADDAEARRIAQAARR